jgi:hypothetical protein
MIAAKAAFTRSIVMQYANFMPGEWLPGDDRGFLRSIYERGRELNVGLGGPDLLPYRPGQLNHSYPLLRAVADAVSTGIAVQWGNYEHRNPKTNQRVTIPELISFATEQLRVEYMFWSTQEPFYSRGLLPHLLRFNEARVSFPRAPALE